MLSYALRLEPAVAARARLELAVKYLEEGKALVDKDLVKASEELYRAAKEAVSVCSLLRVGGNIKEGGGKGAVERRRFS